MFPALTSKYSDIKQQLYQPMLFFCKCRIYIVHADLFICLYDFNTLYTLYVCLFSYITYGILTIKNKIIEF